VNRRDTLRPARTPRSGLRERLLLSTVMLAAALSLAACGNKDVKPGQTLVKVADDEVTVHQLNDELARLDAPDDAARKQALDMLIDRQLLQREAVRNKIDRDIQVVQAIERSKAQILAEAYLTGRVGNIAAPTQAEVQDYFTKHPALFTERKRFEMKELVIATADFSEALQAVMDSAKSLEEVASWLDARNVQYIRRQSARSTADLPPGMAGRLQTMQKGQLFIIKEGERSTLVFLNDVKDTPVGIDAVQKQIEQFLKNEKRRAAATAEIARLRASAKIEYLDKQAAAAADNKAPATPAAATPAGGATHITQGVAGLR
jgi:peptidyl-prolyl cis-trans isomerase C